MSDGKGSEDAKEGDKEEGMIWESLPQEVTLN